MTEKVIFTNLCRVISPDGCWLMENRRDKDYPGFTFPSGHVEKGETFHQAVIREVKEETGLTILNPSLMGVRHWIGGDAHYVIFIYQATKYTGNLVSSSEGEVQWAKPEEVQNLNTPLDFPDNLAVLDDKNVQECCYFCEENRQIKVLC